MTSTASAPTPGTSATRTTASRRRAAPRWQKRFLDVLAETSNVTAAAKRAKTSVGHAYNTRAKDAEFARSWLIALAQGYDQLEMELLHRLREGELSGGTTKKARRKYDNAVAMRLLAAHRESVVRQRALDANRNEDSILDEIDRKLDLMRTRELQAKALLKNRQAAREGNGAPDTAGRDA